MSDTKLIYKKIAAVMAEVGSIGKDRTNAGQGYKFRGIDDVYNAAHPLFVKHGIFSVPRVLKNERSERTSNSGATLLYSIVEMEYTFYAEDGSFVVASAVGEGMDSGDKATNKAMSAAHKYAIIQLLSIPTVDIKDSEYDNHAVKPAQDAIPSFPAPAKSPAAAMVAAAAGFDLSAARPGDFVMPFGKYKGQTLEQMGAHGVDQWRSSILRNMAEKNEQPKGTMVQVLAAVDAFLASRSFDRKAGA